MASEVGSSRISCGLTCKTMVQESVTISIVTGWVTELLVPVSTIQSM